MSESAVAKIKPNNTLPIGISYLEGRIANRRKYSSNDGVFWLSVLKLPAKDKFSHPGTVEIMSQRPIGDVGEDWRGSVEITGYPRTYNAKPDPETGEIRRVNTADIRLRVIEE
jgi:hypothetical protein